MGKLFGTDGIRGEANRYPMTAEIAFGVGQAVAHVFRKNGHRARVIIGKDTRISGYMLESSLEAGITSMGGHPYLVGVLPTPGIAFITQSMRADAGIVISASHNPYPGQRAQDLRRQRVQADRRGGRPHRRPRSSTRNSSISCRRQGAWERPSASMTSTDATSSF